ncbi:MAG: hypothetical protein M1823_000379 [Watsoniomyces obsoletus]|nr:MAG: hypothetical protein M1823_000379 [Watsoniomyces obsoletus]
MPLIEVLPNSSSASAPGWAYVPDTGYDPSKAPIQPTGARQRAARNVPVGGGADLSARQQNAIAKHLVDLEKDNYRDVQIPIPAKSKDGASRAVRGKNSSAVRRILQSQKTFANHLADEEAQRAQQGQMPTTPAVPKPSQTTPSVPKQTPARGRRPKSASMKPVTPGAPETHTEDTLQQPPGPTSTEGIPGAADTDEVEPLLTIYSPLRPPEALLDELLAAPPRPYVAARSKPSALGHLKRRFCEICGYWGRVKCIKCGARVCGLECKGVHDEQRCLRFYA